MDDPQIMRLERIAYEAMVWAKANNIGADQPSLVFARRFAFLLSEAGQSLNGLAQDGSSKQKTEPPSNKKEG